VIRKPVTLGGSMIAVILAAGIGTLVVIVQAVMRLAARRRA